MNYQLLESLGFDAFFRNGGSDLISPAFSPARVTEVNKASFRVADGSHELSAELSGKFLFTSEDSTDFPTVGDWVAIQAFDDLAIIHAILPRKTLLKRKTPGKKIGFQLIAANIDYGLIVQSADSFKVNRLERYLVMCNESGIAPVIVITKIDLLSPTQLIEIRRKTAKLQNKSVLISTIADGGITSLINGLEPQKTYCLLGPSGVGKTSLLNVLVGEDIFQVNEVREKDGRGRHTTVTRQLLLLANGSIFIDTPGMRELGNFDVTEGMEHTFSDIFSYGTECRFSDCSHIHEDGCAVIEAVKLGKINPESYQNYLKIKKESDFYAMSYHDKRKKDKAFGKMISKYKKSNRKK